MELKEFRTKMNSILDTTIDDLFVKAHDLNPVPSGDISPWHHCLVERTKIVLRELIIAQVYLNSDDKENLGTEILNAIVFYDPNQLIIQESKLPQ